MYPLTMLYTARAGMVWEFIGFHPASLSVDFLMSKQVGTGGNYWHFATDMSGKSWLSI